MKQKADSKIVRSRKKTVTKRTKNTKDEQKRTWKQWLFIFTLIVFVGIILYVFLCSSLVKVTEVNITGNNRVSNDAIEDVVKEIIGSNIVSCLNKDNYFFVSKKEIEENILQNKKIKYLEIKKKFPNVLDISITEYDTVAAWCLGDVSGQCFILDDGHAVAETKLDDQILLDNNHFVIVDSSGEDVSVGDRILDEEYLNVIEFLGREFIYNINVEIKTPYNIVSRGSNEVRFDTDEDWYIVVDITQDVDEILNLAKLFMKKVELPGRRNDLEYIDMRFPEKIFYKMKEGIEQVDEVEERDAEEKEEKDKDDDKKDSDK